jgi:glycerol-3-phosphate acyltransferase PlsY
MLNTLYETVVGFLLGAVLFSLLMGQFFAKSDIRTIGDGNPGGINALKAGGVKTGIPAILHVIEKGFLPVFLVSKHA